MSRSEHAVLEVLKENEYKRVEVIRNDADELRVVKIFQGQTPENCLRNARHTHDSLELLNQQFADVLRSPKVYGLDGNAVTMEYLPDLPDARQFGPGDLPLAAEFFAACYKLEVPVDHLGTIANSVHVTREIKDLINAGFPLRLGFKGDLFENLRLADTNPMMADSETASLEPLGLSELLLYIFLAGDSLTRENLAFRCPTMTRPVAYTYLSREQCIELTTAALSYAAQGMSGVPQLVRALKLSRAKRLLMRLLD